MAILGVDPGKHGAFFVIEDNGVPLEAAEMALVKGRTVKKLKRDGEGKRIKKKLKDTPDWDEIAKTFERLRARYRITHVFVERVSGGQSFGRAQAGSFNFGEHYGFICGLVLAAGIPLTRVPATVWKGYWQLKDKTDKDGSRTLAARLLPHNQIRYDRKKDDGVAEAGLIALYGQHHLGGTDDL